MRQILHAVRHPAIQTQVVVRNSEEALAALRMGAAPASELLRFITDSRVSAKLLGSRKLDYSNQRQLLANINNINDAAIAMMGGFLSEPTALKIARNVNSTELAAAILERGRVTAGSVQQVLLGAFNRSNESSEQKSRSATRILQRRGSIDLSLVEGVFAYVINGAAQIGEAHVTSEDAAFALSQIPVDRGTQLGLMQNINNSKDFAVALSGGNLDNDYALRYATGLYDPRLAVLAFGSGAAFSLEVQAALISSFRKSNISKTEKAECALEILRNRNIDPSLVRELQSYTVSNVVTLDTVVTPASTEGLRENGARVINSGQRLEDASIDDIVAMLHREDLGSKESEIKTHAVILLASGIGAAAISGGGDSLVALAQALVENGVNQEALKSLLETTVVGQQVLRQIPEVSLGQVAGDSILGR